MYIVSARPWSQVVPWEAVNQHPCIHLLLYANTVLYFQPKLHFSALHLQIQLPIWHLFLDIWKYLKCIIMSKLSSWAVFLNSWFSSGIQAITPSAVEARILGKILATRLSLPRPIYHHALFKLLPEHQAISAPLPAPELKPSSRFIRVAWIIPVAIQVICSHSLLPPEFNSLIYK